MNTFLSKHTTRISLSLILILLVVTWIYPSMGLIFWLIFLVFSFAFTSLSIVNKQRRKYAQGEITKKVFIRNVGLEITAILCTMFLAAWLGDHIARMATGEVDNVLIKFIAGMLIGLLVGIAVGFFIKRTWNKLSPFLLKSRLKQTE